jgi:chitinase
MRTKLGTIGLLVLILLLLQANSALAGAPAIVKVDQAITFLEVANQTYGVPPIRLTASASSGLAVKFASHTTHVCAVSGGIVTLRGAGTCIVRATQAGNARFAPAPAVDRAFLVAPQPASVALTGLDRVYNGRQASAACTTTPSGLKKVVSYSHLGSGIDRIDAGTYGVTCSVAHPGYAGGASGTLTIAKRSQRIEFTNPGTKTASDAPFPIGATANSGLRVNFISLTSAACSVSDGVVTPGAGTCTIRASQPGNRNYTAAADVDRSFKIRPTVTLTKLAHVYDGSQKSAACETIPNGLATVIKYKNTGSGTGRINAGSYWTICTVTEPGITGRATGTLTIAKADQSIDFAPLEDKVLGAEPFTVSATASSSLPVSFSSGTPEACSVSGALVTLLQAGTCTVAANQDGDINHHPAANAVQSFAITGEPEDDLHYLAAYDSALQGDWSLTIWDDPDHRVTANPDAAAPGRTGNAIEVQYSVNGWGGFGLANMRDWNNVHYMYLNEFKTIEFDLFVASDTDGLENLLFLLDDAGYNDERRLTSYIAGWDPAHPEHSYGRWIPISIDLSQIGARIPRFMRFLFYNNGGPSRPHFYMANVRLGWMEDTTPPAFTSVSMTPNLTYDRLTLAFTTDKATTYRVEYGVGNYDTVIDGEPGDLAPSHSSVLTGVSRGNTYQYRITASSHHTDPTVPPTPSVYTGTYAMPAAPTAPPLIANFTATPSEIPLGENTRLMWDATDYVSLSIDQGVGSVAQVPGSTGVLAKPVAATTTYTITATNALGSATRTVTVITHAVPTAHSFTATPAKIGSGDPATLTWNVAEFDSISIDHGVGVVTGTAGSTGVVVNPTETTTYTLTATNATVVVDSPSTNPVWVMGYYIGYQRTLQQADQVDYSAMTHILIGAAPPRADGTFETHFYISDTAGPQWAKDAVQRAHAAGIKAILMVGGAGSIAGFEATADPAVRAAFVSNLKAIVDDYGFDGVDLDWEPIHPNSHGNAMIALMEALQAPGALPRSSYLYTLPVGWNNANFNDMADPFYGTIATYFDRVSTMSYSALWIGDGWQSWHSSALHGETPRTPSSIANTVDALRAAGVPDAKIGIGIGFYGTAFENGRWINGSFVHLDPPAIPSYVTGPLQETDTTFSRYGDNQMSYSNIMEHIYAGTAYRWDDSAKVPYLSFSTPALFNFPGVSNLRTTFVTYDDEQAIAEKGSFVKRQNLGAVMVWTISQGYLGGWKTTGELDPLMKAVKSAFRD